MKGQASLLPSLKNIAEHINLGKKTDKGKGKAKDFSEPLSRDGDFKKLKERYQTLLQQRSSLDTELQNIQELLDSSSDSSSDGNSHLYASDSDSDNSVWPYLVSVVESESEISPPPYTPTPYSPTAASCMPSTPSRASRPAPPAATPSLSRPPMTPSCSLVAACLNTPTPSAANGTPTSGNSLTHPSNPPTPRATNGKPKYKKTCFGYVVYRGKETGAFKYWNMVHSIISNDTIALYKGFPTFQAAREVYVHTQDTGVINALSLHSSQSQQTQDNRVYVVTEGTRPGVYQDAFSALQRGLQWNGGALHPKGTVAEANQFFVTEYMGGRVRPI
ncbi:hypothetical protein D9758_018535 [Tetrapyrgos nigripes]|uniref:Ribonuclease H1 N-terminal domain-containing protein n=1 Tax=Tetrapyrgos nigripes TaxID=182062 RepID=A0A8H5BT54_9AGAR|nr:hypothetical protein D9758_018535 [Tetrapyrgos nigripes]